jgi:hypothetical protein
VSRARRVEEEGILQGSGVTRLTRIVSQKDLVPHARTSVAEISGVTISGKYDESPVEEIIRINKRRFQNYE